MAATSSHASENFLFLSGQQVQRAASLIRRADISGVQIVYNWKALEVSKDRYDFSQIEADLAYLTAANKKLFIQIQDRFFEPQARNLPAYLLNEPSYQGGLAPQFDRPGENKPLTAGWVAEQWNPLVRQRFQKLLQALATQFDGRVFGINLPESAIELDTRKKNAGFTCDGYFAAELENLAYARKVFSKSVVVQYVNFWPCEWQDDHHYMSRMFEFASNNNIGLGGPDIVPNLKVHMKNAYPLFNHYKGKLRIVAMAVQEPTLTYKNPATGKAFTRDEIVDFAETYLGADIIFWSTASPWLQ